MMLSRESCRLRAATIPMVLCFSSVLVLVKILYLHNKYLFEKFLYVDFFFFLSGLNLGVSQ